MNQQYQRTLEYCQQKYQTILPHQDLRAQTVQSSQIVQIIKQFEILIQLLVQNAMLSKTDLTRLQSIQLLESLEKPIEQDFSLDLSQISDLNTTIEVSPLKNTFQFQLLRHHKIILESKKNDTVDALKNYYPFVKLEYIPVVCSPSNKVRCKFSILDEELLYQGLHRYGSKNLDAIQKEFLWDKNIKQIKNKYKNSICSNAIMNKIKQWKLNQYEYLSKQEVDLLVKGIQWFGDKPQLIHKFILKGRSQDFISNELKKSDTLLKKRRKHNINETYPDYYEQIFKAQKKKVQLKVWNIIIKPVTKEPHQNVENFFNFQSLNYENSNSFFFKSFLENSKFAVNNAPATEDRKNTHFQSGLQKWSSLINQIK